MTRDKVDARVRQPPALGVQIAAARQPRRQLRDASAIPAPEGPQRVAILAVPFRPAWRKVADLISAFTEIPWLGDQLHLRQHRILVNDVEERPQLVDGVQFSRERAGQIETEAVD